MRIVGGEWRSRRIRFPTRDNLRPTPDRVRETLFNWLGQDLTGLVCLDLFSGSGALGFEAASRGAGRVVMVEQDRTTHAALEENRNALKATQVELVRGDALEFVRADRGQYDVIFVDPPFSAPCGELLPKLLGSRLRPDGYVYYESAAGLEWPPEWQVLRQSSAGKVVFQLVKRIGDEPHGGIPGDVRSDHARP